MDRNKLIEDYMYLTNRIAKEYHKKNKRYDLEEYIAYANLGLVKAGNKFKGRIEDFEGYAAVSIYNQIKSVFINDKYYNYMQGKAMKKDDLPTSLNLIVNPDAKGNNVYERQDLLVSRYDDDTYKIVKDYIIRIFSDFYDSFNSRAERFKANKDRDINVVLYICKGYTPMEVSRALGISNQLVNSIIKKFKKYALENDLKYCIN